MLERFDTAETTIKDLKARVDGLFNHIDSVLQKLREGHGKYRGMPNDGIFSDPRRQRVLAIYGSPKGDSSLGEPVELNAVKARVCVNVCHAYLSSIISLQSTPFPNAPSHPVECVCTFRSQEIYESYGIEVDLLLSATPKELLDQLGKGDVAVLHWVAHMDLKYHGSCVPALVDQDGDIRCIDEDRIVRIFEECPPRMVILNGCCSATLGKRLVAETGVEVTTSWETKTWGPAASIFGKAISRNLANHAPPLRAYVHIPNLFEHFARAFTHSRTHARNPHTNNFF